MKYFDYAAATPLSPTARKAMEPYFAELFYNPSAQYLAAQGVKKDIEKARADVAAALGVKNSEIIFTAGGTESDNLAISGIMRGYPEANCVISSVEHEAVLAPAALFDHKKVPVKPDGRIDLTALEKLIDDKTVLVSIMYANNEIGTIQPLAAVSKIISDIRLARVKKDNKLPLYFHTDAAQAPNYLHLLVNTLGIDLMSLNAGKIYGPKQTGALYVSTGIIIQPEILGGGQERGLRSGTQNTANIIGFAAALEEAGTNREKEHARLKILLGDFISQLLASYPGSVVNGSTDYRLPNNAHLTFPGKDNERLMMELDAVGFVVAAGSACSASSNEPSHVLKAIGLSDHDARSSLRVTFGRQTTKKDVDALLKRLLALLSQ